MYVAPQTHNPALFATQQTCDSPRCTDEHILRKRIKELQLYRNLGLRTPADIEKYEADSQKRVSAPFSPLPVASREVNVSLQNAVKNSYTSRDFFPERRMGGNRASSGPDPRRGMNDDHEREATPKLGASGVSGTGPPARKMRTSSSPLFPLRTS